MTAPTGTSLLSNMTNKSAWYVEDGSTVTQLTETGPSGDVVLRNTCVDGQINTPGAEPSERSDLAGPNISVGQTRWMLWYERYISLANNNGNDRWQISGPNEIHGQTLSQATFMPEVGLDYRKRINANAGLPTTRYFDVGPIVLNEWHQYKMGIFYTQSSSGWFEIWRDGVMVIRFDGATTSETASGYWKFGNYRNADYSGTSTIDVSGVRIYG